MKRKVIMVISMVCFVGFLFQNAEAFVVINEILANPPVGATGDSNRDGVVSSIDDEFVELVNMDDVAVDLSGWRINDAIRTRHIFPIMTTISPYGFFVVFGGGDPLLPGIHWQVASTGTLSLNNTEETVYLLDNKSAIVDSLHYKTKSSFHESLVRFPEGEGIGFKEHSSLAGAQGRNYSAGTAVDGGSRLRSVVPEPRALMSFSLGILVLLSIQRNARKGDRYVH